jgi:hypothetical protein
MRHFPQEKTKLPIPEPSCPSPNLWITLFDSGTVFSGESLLYSMIVSKGRKNISDQGTSICNQEISPLFRHTIVTNSAPIFTPSKHCGKK